MKKVPRTMRVRKLLLTLGLGLLGSIPLPCLAQTTPHAGMMRFPDVSTEKIVFVYGEDLWVVSREGGQASPLASPPGEESIPRFSPDGKTIAFVGNYDGNNDLYTISVEGGAATRVTYHPSNELLCDWTPDGKLIYSSDCYSGLQRQSQLFVRSVDEPLPTKLAVPYGTNGSISPDGQWLAYTPHSHDNRTWKRYRGGMASDVWLFNLQTNESKQITDFEGTDSLPMWHGSIVYYLSDAGPEHRLNVWSFDTKTTERKQITQFQTDDCKFPGIGPGPKGTGEIVVQNGASLYLIDLATSQSKAISITVPGDRPKLRPRNVDAANYISDIRVSPNAKRIAVEARGDIWTVPVKNGSPRNLTRTSGVAERDPSWSPDGQSIAFLSDKTGEYELYVARSDDGSQVKQLTSNGTCFRYLPSWSPDSKWIYYCDKTGAMFLYSLEKSELKQCDRDPGANQIAIQWSHNSEWITYAREEEGRSTSSALWIYNVLNGTKQKITSGYFNDSSPVFDRKGEHLFFVSNRAINAPKYEELGTTFIYSDTQVLLAMPLRTDVPSLLKLESDEELPLEDPNIKKDVDDTTSKPKAETDASAKSTPFQPIVIDLNDLERRAYPIPIAQGRFGRVGVNDKGMLVYGRLDQPSANDDESSETGSIKIFDFGIQNRKVETVVDGQSQFAITPDGKKLLVVAAGQKKSWVIESSAKQELKDPIAFQGMNTVIEPMEEWKQVLRDAWRIERDYFYDPNMHGVDWKATYEHYASMLPDCVSRRDVSFLIREMISELNVGHAYYDEGDVEQAPKAANGVLGARVELHDGAFRIAELYQGAVWDHDARNPLAANGVKVGDYWLAVNGLPIDAKLDPYSYLQRLANQTVTLTFSADPKLDRSDRTIAMKLMGDDSQLRFRQWIEWNRRYVEEKTNGRVGYVYVMNTGIPGQNDLVRQFYGQRHKDALIIDDRWNGGGQIPTRFIELLNRPATNFWALRDGKDWVWSPDSHQGPKCMLANGMAGSGGDMFPALFKQSKLGKVIGMRTWGGLVGISGNPEMIDGSSVTAPTFAFYELNGTWGIEGHGVDPDIKVVDDPALLAKGIDPQLDVAIQTMLSEIETHGFKKPDRPAYPDRKAFGIRPEDK